MVRKCYGLRLSVIHSPSTVLFFFYIAFLHVDSTSKQMASWLVSLIVFLIFVSLFFKLPSTGHHECLKIQHTSFTKTKLIPPKKCIYSLASFHISKINTITLRVSQTRSSTITDPSFYPLSSAFCTLLDPRSYFIRKDKLDLCEVPGLSIPGQEGSQVLELALASMLLEQIDMTPDICQAGIG